VYHDFNTSSGETTQTKPICAGWKFVSLATGSHGYTDKTRFRGFGVRDKFLTKSVYEDFYGNTIANFPKYV
jgi:DNA mismatch repair protein MutH